MDKIKIEKRIEFYNRLLINNGDVKCSADETGIKPNTCRKWLIRKGITLSSSDWQLKVEGIISALHDERDGFKKYEKNKYRKSPNELKELKDDVEVQGCHENQEPKYTIPLGTSVLIRNILKKDQDYYWYETKKEIGFENHNGIEGEKDMNFCDKTFRFRYRNFQIKIFASDLKFRNRKY